MQSRVSRLAYLQVSCFIQQTDLLSWTMHVPLHKFPWNTKFLLKTTLVIFITTPWPLSHAHQKFKLSDCRTTMQKHCETSKMLQVRNSYTYHMASWALFLCAKSLIKQMTKHHVQDGRPMAEFLLAANKQRWSLMMTSCSSIDR